MALLLLLPSLLAAGIPWVCCSEYYGKVIGELEDVSHGVKGSVYVADERTLFLKGFSYDGTAAEAHFWAGNETWANSGGILIADEHGSFAPLGVYQDQDLILKLPAEVGKVTELGVFAVWDKANGGGSLGSVILPDNLDPPQAMTLGPFSSPVRSGPVVLKNVRTLDAPRVRAQCDQTGLEFLVGNSSVPGLNGSRVLVKEVGSQTEGGAIPYSGSTTTTLTFPEGITALDVSWVAVRCAAPTDPSTGGQEPGPLLGHVYLPRSHLNVPPAHPSTHEALESSPRGDKDLGDVYHGTHLGRFQETDHGVTGTVFAVNQDTILIRGFSYDGRAPDARFWVGSTERPSPQGFILPNEHTGHRNLRAYRGREDIVLRFPNGRSLRDIRWIAVWCKAFNANFGHVFLPRQLRIPGEVVLGPLPTLAHGVRSEPVRILDEQTIFIPKMHYDGQAPDAYFLVGNGQRIHHRNAVKLSRNGNFGRLQGAMRGEDVLLRIPGRRSVRDFDWLSVYCILAREDFGHVFFPKNLLIPPSLEARSQKTARLQKKPSDYFGKKLGDFKDGVHRVQGTLYAANNNTLFLEGFSYDGLGHETYFWVGNDSTRPSSAGHPIPDDNGSNNELQVYEDQNLIIQLPNNQTLRDFKYLSIWSKRIRGSFGHVTFPDPLNLPSSRSLGPLTTYAHGVSSGPVEVLDAKTLLIRELRYDGKGPDAFFLVGKGPYPLPNGTKVPDENGSLKKIHAYNGEDITVRLPGNLTIFDIDWFSLYCITYTENFGHVFIPKDLNVPADTTTLLRKTKKWENCEVIFPDVLQVSWTLEKENIHIQLQGVAKPNEYLSFGLSPDPAESQMVGSDVILAFQRVSSNMAQVQDYHLSAKAQCSDGVGVCPDVKVAGNDDVTMTSSHRTGDLLTISYRRPLKTDDDKDLPIETGHPVAVVAAIGHLDSRDQAAFHHTYYTKSTVKIHFGRPSSGLGECNDLTEVRTLRRDDEPEVDEEPPVDTKEGRKEEDNEPELDEAPAVDTKEGRKEEDTVEMKANVEDNVDTTVPWNRGKISPDVAVFQASLGPTGGKLGYDAITGRHSWGYAWWINGELIPELEVTRGRTYTFQVEGGPRHPLYITEDPQGGGTHYQELLGKPGHLVFAGLVKNSTTNEYSPIGVGRLCELKRDNPEEEDERTYEAFKSGLMPVCQEGNPGTFFWTPDQDTPDLVYYHCFVHRNFGWKIHVKDSV